MSPHDGSIFSYALQLQLIDNTLRLRLTELIKKQELHLLYAKINSPKATAMFDDVVRNVNAPLPHPMRQLLCIALDVECPTMQEIPSSLVNMKVYPV